ncbi:MAG: hypothetical protein HY674_06650 [Chloroflexi bacterium]|nr:hypothetical protein [Chloroflexota bacterium]
MANLFRETGLQFLALNYIWQIDPFHRKRSGAYVGATANTIKQAQTRSGASAERR